MSAGHAAHCSTPTDRYVRPRRGTMKRAAIYARSPHDFPGEQGYCIIAPIHAFGSCGPGRAGADSWATLFSPFGRRAPSSGTVVENVRPRFLECPVRPAIAALEDRWNSTGATDFAFAICVGLQVAAGPRLQAPRRPPGRWPGSRGRGRRRRQAQHRALPGGPPHQPDGSANGPGRLLPEADVLTPIVMRRLYRGWGAQALPSRTGSPAPRK